MCTVRGRDNRPRCTDAVRSYRSDNNMLEPLLQFASDLAADLTPSERYQRFLALARRMIPCDSVVLLRMDEGAFVPIAVDGLRAEAIARRYHPDDHPRLARIREARAPVRFDDTGMPDPFDGLFAHAGDALSRAHSCMGCAVLVDSDVIGAVVFDALTPGCFDRIDLENVSMLATLAGAAIRTSALSSALAQLGAPETGKTRQLVREALDRMGGNLLGTSDQLARVRREIDLLARSELTALITGETGVGKELVAQAIHTKSSRADKPMVVVNCAALPDSLAESELFGHLRGAFTGAVDHRAGKFEVADGGTLFLDEVGELPLAVQSKLLRALQYGEVQRIGSDRLLRVDVRVIAATNRDLGEEVRAGHFRADLLYRLGVFPLHIPPLREHPEDIGVLSGHFLDLARERLGVGPIRLAPAARKVLREHGWPGNVRELEHTLMRGSLRASERYRGGTVLIDVADLGLADPAPVARTSSGKAPRLRDAVDGFTKDLISTTVRECDGNWAEAARRLGLQRGNLHRLATRLRLHGRA
ncbi:MAG TPA: nitric oxide reductase transcriptional regulator NorR [Kofleriaceae bacterium]|nr:nitric oxide reductase transcriptional regulator NorR [Kofleriaceae bacterium]